MKYQGFKNRPELWFRMPTCQQFSCAHNDNGLGRVLIVYPSGQVEFLNTLLFWSDPEWQHACTSAKTYEDAMFKVTNYHFGSHLEFGGYL